MAATRRVQIKYKMLSSVSQIHELLQFKLQIEIFPIENGISFNRVAVDLLEFGHTFLPGSLSIEFLLFFLVTKKTDVGTGIEPE